MSTMEGAQAAEAIKGRETDIGHAPDTWSFVFWSGAVLVAAMALPTANWTDDLGAVPLIAAAGLGLGALLVLSRFRAATAFMLAAGYGVALILWQMTETLDPAMAWRERVFDLVARIANFLSVVLAGQPSRDSLMFVLAMSLVFWTMAVFGTWWLFRRGGLWLAFLLPGVAVFLNVYYYRYGTRLQIYLPVFLLLALAAVVHLELNRRRRGWEARRAQVSTDVSSRVTQSGIVAALLLIVVAWMTPSIPDVESEQATAITGSRSPFNDFFSDALAGLRAPVNLYGETFSGTLALGAGRPPGTRVAFQARALAELPPGLRVYWRARTYDVYEDGGWEITVGDSTSYRPRQAEASEAVNAGRVDLEFTVSSFLPAVKLLYLPAEVAWINRSADMRQVTEDGRVVDTLEVYSAETLLPGDSYRVRSRLAAPLGGDLRNAGRAYPAWVEQAYLQVPPELPGRVGRLAREITADAPTPFDKAEAITAWLRSNIIYDREAAAAPEGTDPVEWFLFDSRTGFCDYYASAEVLMLRSLGIPSRLAVGFAQGAYDSETGQFVVTEADLHAWPEVYFPGYGWVEFEPTVSQPALERAEGASGPQGTAGGDENDAGAQDPGSGLPLDPFGGMDDVENIEIPETPVAPTPWLAYGVLAAAALGLLMYVTPARRVVAVLAVAGAQRTGRRVPRIVEDWASAPSSESAAVFRRLAPWPNRLGVALDDAATPGERAGALAEQLPHQAETITTIADAYIHERYGGQAAAKGEAGRAWRRLRPHLYRASLRRLLGGLFLPQED